MKALTERLFWVEFELREDAQLSKIGARSVAVDECNCCLAIAEVCNVKPLIERLEFIRNYLAGEHSDQAAAMNRMIECLAIAEALPDISLAPAGIYEVPTTAEERLRGTYTNQPPAGERAVPVRVTYNPDRDANCVVHYSRRNGEARKLNLRTGEWVDCGPAPETVYEFSGPWGTPIPDGRELTFEVGDTIELFHTGEFVRIHNPDNPDQWVDIQRLGVRIAEPPAAACSVCGSNNGECDNGCVRPLLTAAARAARGED